MSLWSDHVGTKFAAAAPGRQPMMRPALLALGALGVIGGLPGLCHAQTQMQGCQDMPQKPAPTIVTNFGLPWAGLGSPDRLWRLNGPWEGTGGNVLDPTLARTGSPQSGALTLSVAPREKRGSEVQTLDGYGYGYYEARMRVADEPGVVASFFWIEAPGYGPHEWDFEFLTNEPWVGSADRGEVHLTLHPSNSTVRLPLPFNPSKSFHRYGFLWTPGRIVFAVDGTAAHTFSEDDLTTPAKGFIMMNTWTGNPDWGGGPPSKQATTAYTCVTFTAGLTSIPQ